VCVTFVALIRLTVLKTVIRAGGHWHLRCTERKISPTGNNPNPMFVMYFDPVRQ
jgi:hypothetical protein